MKKISFGAEAIIYKDKDKIVKDRVKKNYRLDEIDFKLRRSRTRREAKILSKLEDVGFPSPKPILMDDKTMIIEMEEIKGDKLRDVLEKKDFKKLSKEIGKKLASLHNAGIIHGDLTTSNLILNEEIYFIDFGLSFFSNKVEDKAVDLHLLKQALESKHYRIWEECMKNILSSYKKTAEDSSEIMTRFDVVEGRGRNKSKISITF